jgi:folylpolyglutamate synthase/dihydropteroate synthase
MSRGLKATAWPGRFQILPGKGGSPTWLLDVCHNSAGATAFVDTFTRLFPGRKAAFVVGLVKRKEHQEIIDRFAKVADRFCLVPLASKRSVDIKQLIASIDWHGVPVRRFGRLATARNSLLKQSESHSIIALVGSHYLVGEFLSNYGKG